MKNYVDDEKLSCFHSIRSEWDAEWKIKMFLLESRARSVLRLSQAKESEALVVVASDLLALTVLKPPGEWGADIVIGSSQVSFLL